MAWTQRHLIIVPANLQTQANAEAIKWDPDAGGGGTFGVPLSSDGGESVTHYASNGLIDVDYVPPDQGGQTALQILDAFYATGHYKGYRVREPSANDDALQSGAVEHWRPAHLDDEGVPQPAGWYDLGTGSISNLALQESGLSKMALEGV